MNSQSHWALPPGKKSPAMVCLITIRKNKQSESTAESSTSHLNRTKSSQSNKVGITPNMIPCFPASNGTDAHHCDTISNRSSPSHLQRIVLLIFPKSEPTHLQTIYATALENQDGYYLRKVIRGNAHAVVHLRMINSFLKLNYCLFP